MGNVTLLLGIHNHQPQGNFDEVFARGYADCYRRIVDAIARHPAIRIALHHSGPLIEWIEGHHPEYFDDLARLVEEGRVEILGGGFYEPMLSVLPEQDAQGQLRMMADYIAERFGSAPRGMWLAERVWEPDLARVIASGGYRYTLLDDGHFVGAGLRRPLRGHYVTDKAGQTLSLFPIAKELRYAIPFSPADEAIASLLKIADEAEGELILTYGDDGEKFGMWPHTKEWVWDKGWLDSFFSGIADNADRIRTATFSSVLDRVKPLGRVYLPTASYDEMGEWSLPAAAQPELQALQAQIGELGQQERWGPFVRGGIWQGFLAKYPESNLIHKRMCHVSARVGALDEGAAGPEGGTADARRELYRGQCNCPYWHGLFGGLYSPKLRSAVQSHLIRAERLCRQLAPPEHDVDVTVVDYDGDLGPEVVVDAPALGLVLSPDRGGAALAIDHRQRAFQVDDTLTRRPEAYHQRIRELATKQQGAQDDDAPKSIHHISELKDKSLSEALIYDPHQRLSFVDHFYEADAPLDRLWRCEPLDRGDFAEGGYTVGTADGGPEGLVVLGRKGTARPAEGDTPAVAARLAKRFAVPGGDGQLDGSSPVLELSYEIEIAPETGAPALLFATELSLALPSGPHPDGRLRIEGTEAIAEQVTARGLATGARRVELVDPFTPLRVRLDVEPAATLVYFPLETASQSESGFERTYQGTVLVLAWPCPAEEPPSPRIVLSLG